VAISAAPPPLNGKALARAEISMDKDLQKTVEALEHFNLSHEEGWAAIKRRREAWPGAKATIMAALNELLATGPSKTHRRLYLTEGRPFEHFDAVQIRFGSVPTGLVSNSDRRTSHGIEKGPTLVFGQSEPGLICVLRYPAETRLPNEPPAPIQDEFVETLEPEAVTRTTVLKIATEFLGWACDATLAGGTSGTRRPIGFMPKLTLMDDEPG
jgi:hypothetical protein